MTWEVTGSSSSQRDWLKGFIGILLVEWEYLDEQTWNITVPDDRADDVVEWAERHSLEIRLV